MANFNWHKQTRERILQAMLEGDRYDYYQMRDVLRSKAQWGVLANPGPVRASFGLPIHEFVLIMKDEYARKQGHTITYLRKQ